MSFKKITKCMLKTVGLIVMIYQIIDITVMYLNFPFNVYIEVKSELYSRIPSISFCLCKIDIKSINTNGSNF